MLDPPDDLIALLPHRFQTDENLVTWQSPVMLMGGSASSPGGGAAQSACHGKAMTRGNVSSGVHTSRNGETALH